MSAQAARETGADLRRIFIVEDAPDFRELLTELLESEGYHVESAANGREALDRLADPSYLPHLILLDLMMPVMDGSEFRRRQLSDQRLSEVPIVIMTAHRDLQAARTQLGAHDCIRKPPELEQILSIVKRYST